MSIVKLEYNSAVWSPYSNTNSLLENVQNRFLCFMSFKCNIIHVPHLSYQPLLNTLNILSLSNISKINEIFVQTTKWFCFLS